MQAPWYSALDLGTHSTILLLARVAPDTGDLVGEHELFRVTRLGTGLARSGRLDAAAVRHTLDTAAEFVARVPRPCLGVAAATSAVRDAADGPAFLAACARLLGAPPRLLSGVEEARAVFAGGASDLPADAFCACIDIGGGSTELAVGYPGRCCFHASVDLGCARLGERFGLLDGGSVAAAAAARAEAVRLLQPVAARLRAAVPAGMPLRLIASGGTATTLAALELGLARFDRRRVHGARLDAATVEAWSRRLLPLPAAERAGFPGLPADRAGVLPAGLLILASALAALGVDAVQATTRGLRYGLLLQLVRGEIAPTWTWPGDAP